MTIDDYANNTTTTGRLNVGGSITGNLETRGDRDWFRVELQAGTEYQFNLNGNTLSDTYLRLLDSNGNLVTYNDDANGSRNSQIVFTANTSGTFYLSAGSFYDWYRGTYTLSSTVLSDDYANNTTTTGRLNVDGSITGNLETRGDRDWFRVELQAGTEYQFNLNGNTLSDTYLRLLDSNGNLVTENDDANGSYNSQIVFRANTSGTFYLSAGSFSDWYRGTYTLSSTVLSVAPQDDYANNTTTRGRVNVDGSITGNLETEGDRDWFAIDLQQGSVYHFNLNGNTLSDTYLRLLDSNGNVIAYNDDANSSRDSQIIFRSNTSGTYYLSAGSYNDSFTGTYTLSSSLRSTDYSEITGYGETRVDLALAQLLGVNVPRVSDLGGNSWGLDRIGAPEAWAMGYRGQGTVVAVLDTGVDWTHSDLNDNIWINTDEIAGNGIDDDRNGYIDDVRGWDFANRDNNPNDVQGHGTHVAGTIAAEANNIGISGVAPDAKIMAVKVLGDDGSGYITDIAAGIRYAVDNGAHVINMSLGGGGVNPTINSAIQYATSRGSLVVMAAGNSGGG